MKSRDVSRSTGWFRKAVVTLAVASAGVATIGLVSGPPSQPPVAPPAVSEDAGRTPVSDAPTTTVAPTGIKLPGGGEYEYRAGIRW